MLTECHNLSNKPAKVNFVPNVKFIPKGQVKAKTLSDTLWRVALGICQKHGLTLHQLRSKRKFQPLCAARFEFYYEAYAAGLQLIDIGQFMGRDHTTIGYGASRFCLIHDLPFPAYAPWKCSLNTRRYPRRLYQCGERTRRRVAEIVYG